jgi:hypothetical protein
MNPSGICYEGKTDHELNIEMCVLMNVMIEQQAVLMKRASQNALAINWLKGSFAAVGAFIGGLYALLLTHVYTGGIK